MTNKPFATLESSEGFESGWNRLQTAIEILVAVIIVAALSGLLGTGPLSSGRLLFTGKPLEVSYERILRKTVATQMTFKTTAPLETKEVEIELPNKLTDEIDVVGTSPRSTAMRAEADGIVYTFALGDAKLGTITFSVKPRVAGYIESVFRSGAATAAFRTLVLP